MRDLSICHRSTFVTFPFAFSIITGGQSSTVVVEPTSAYVAGNHILFGDYLAAVGALPVFSRPLQKAAQLLRGRFGEQRSEFYCL